MENIDKKQFGSFIAEIRKEKGMTQQDLANLAIPLLICIVISILFL